MGGGGKSTLCTMPTGRGVPISFSKGFGDSSCKLFELEEIDERYEAEEAALRGDL